jgi:hypothetical protein
VLHWIVAVKYKKMDKKSLHRLWTIIRPVKVWYLLVLCLMSAALTVVALRANNLHMVTLRDKVHQVDQAGGDVEGALQDLRTYVYGHMNTGLATGSNVYPPVQLKYTYQRLKQAETDRVKSQNDSIYRGAQAYCEQQNPTDFSGRNRVPCIEAYVKSHSVTERKIPDAMYKFAFVSPTWSPDLAGFSLLISILLAVLLIARIIAGRVLKALTK